MKSKIIRVGESETGFTRIRKGFNHQLTRYNNKKNFHAYQWRESYKNKTINIDFYNLIHPDFSRNDFRRSLEAEVTFLLRKTLNKWPENMTEIHFSEKHRENQVIEKYSELIVNNYSP